MKKILSLPLIIVFLLCSLTIQGQKSYLSRTVRLPAGRMTLKETFSQLSKQTGCEFSYDPARIDEKMELLLDSELRKSLRDVLRELLPENLTYTTLGKYIILKPAKPGIRQTSSLRIPENRLEILLPDPLAANTLKTGKPASTIRTLPEREDRPDTGDSTVFADSTSTDTSVKSTWIEWEAASSLQRTSLSARLGKSHLHAALSLAYDHHGSYHLGLGAGTSLNLTKSLQANLDLTGFGLLAGKTRKQDIRAYTTVLRPDLTVSIGQHLKLFAGPSFTYVQSRLVTGSSRIALGSHFSCEATAGIRFTLPHPFRNQNHPNLP